MAKPLSARLSDLSVHVKSAEDAVAAAQKEAHDKVVARRDQAHKAATAAIEKVNQDIKSASDAGASHWNALKAKVAADIDHLKTRMAEHKHERDVKRADANAEKLEWQAEFAIDYAVASVEQAKLAILDAIAGRVDANQARAS
jgi:hypothetical protein